MCMLTFLPAGVVPDVAALANGAFLNDDGHGFAIVANGRLLVRRGMDADHMVTSFERMRGKYRDGPALFHSRFATHGTIRRDNCHPFRVGGDRRTVVAHNGILPKSLRPRPGDKRSDTRVAAEDFLPHNPFGSIESRANRDRLGQWLGHGNKLVILTVDRRYGDNAYIVNEDSGIWDHGIWYSNNDYREDAWAQRYEVRETVACPVCHRSDVVDLETGFCAECGCCIDCGAPVEHCYCYASEKALTRT